MDLPKQIRKVFGHRSDPFFAFQASALLTLASCKKHKTSDDLVTVLAGLLCKVDLLKIGYTKSTEVVALGGIRLQ